MASRHKQRRKTAAQRALAALLLLLPLCVSSLPAARLPRAAARPSLRVERSPTAAITSTECMLHGRDIGSSPIIAVPRLKSLRPLCRAKRLRALIFQLDKDTHGRESNRHKVSDGLCPRSQEVTGPGTPSKAPQIFSKKMRTSKSNAVARR